ncbi:MAG: D-aminoacyl-tRNA deacylase [Armatimonadota bacterium]
MRAVVQRSLASSVSVDGRTIGSITRGLVVLLGVGQGDTEAEAAFMADKIANLRIFEDEQGKMNLSVLDVGGQVLLISQFTLYGDCRKGRRPSFISAAPPDEADRLYRRVADLLREMGLVVSTGEFGAHMLVSIQNDGPVTILLDSERAF